MAKFWGKKPTRLELIRIEQTTDYDFRSAAAVDIDLEAVQIEAMEQEPSEAELELDAFDQSDTLWPLRRAA